MIFRLSALLVTILSVLQSLCLAQVDDSTFLITLQNEELLILSENHTITFTGQKAEFIEVLFENEAEYEILSDPGALFPFELPEKNDPTYQPHGSRIKNKNRLFDDLRIHSFDVSVKKPDGSLYSPEIKREEKKTRVVTERNMFGYLYSYLYGAKGIEKGDVVKIKYSYSIRYIYNYFKMFSFRMFLHDQHPRKKYNLTLIHHFALEVDTFFINNSRPEKKFTDDQVTYHWDLKNLPGCLDEPGSRPYIDLPWFTITVKPYELLYQDFNSFRETFVPMWYYLSARRESDLRSAVDDQNIGAKDRDNLAFEKLAARYKRMAPDDSSGIERLRYFQRFMVDSVVYDDDFAYYDGDENYLKDHPGIQLTGQRVKDHLQEYVYASMLSKLDLQYFTAYVADSRSGAMSVEYYAPVYDNELLFAPILNNNTLAYLLPKSDCRNLYCEELPFYYEKAPVLLIYTYDFAGYKRNFNELVRIVTTPGSAHTDNFRKTNSMVKVNLEDKTVTFQTRISMSGQYSTMTRFNYNNMGTDSTVNSRYLDKVWEIGGEPEIQELTMTETDLYFPYKTSVSANYQITDLILNADDHYSIDIGEWTRHIIENSFISKGRQTDYYADFLGSDTYGYMLNFSTPVKLISIHEDISIDNEFGTFKYGIKQVSPTQVLLNSYFIVKQPVMENEKINLVQEIYHAIEFSESASLEFQTE